MNLSQKSSIRAFAKKDNKKAVSNKQVIVESKERSISANDLLSIWGPPPPLSAYWHQKPQEAGLKFLLV